MHLLFSLIYKKVSTTFFLTPELLMLNSSSGYYFFYMVIINLAWNQGNSFLFSPYLAVYTSMLSQLLDILESSCFTIVLCTRSLVLKIMLTLSWSMFLLALPNFLEKSLLLTSFHSSFHKRLSMVYWAEIQLYFCACQRSCFTKLCA